jgi:hypothetical protein
MKLYTLGDVAKICRLSKRTIYNHVWQGKLKTHKKYYGWGKTISFVTEEDFKRYLFDEFFKESYK